MSWDGRSCFWELWLIEKFFGDKRRREVEIFISWVLEVFWGDGKIFGFFGYIVCLFMVKFSF